MEKPQIRSPGVAADSCWQCPLAVMGPGFSEDVQSCGDFGSYGTCLRGRNMNLQGHKMFTGD